MGEAREVTAWANYPSLGLGLAFPGAARNSSTQQDAAFCRVCHDVVFDTFIGICFGTPPWGIDASTLACAIVVPLHPEKLSGRRVARALAYL
jgi:hypothetical protein